MRSLELRLFFVLVKRKPMKNKCIVLILFLVSVIKVQGLGRDSVERRHFIGSTLFVLANLAPDPPHYYQLNYGYRITPRNVVSFEAITWTYPGPLGRPYGPDFDNPKSNFPGKVQAYGSGLAYKRFLWKRSYLQVHSTALHQNYLDGSGKKIQSGFQWFNVFRLGYQLRLCKQRIFVEPSVAATS